MTARLHTPGGDDGDWGIILNDFLEVSLNSDGTLLTGALQQAGGVTTVNGHTPTNGIVTLTADDVQAVPSSSVGTASGVASLTSSTQVPLTQLGSGTASNSNFLRGDGTWAVPNSGSTALDQDTDVAIVSPSNGQVLTYDTAQAKWNNETLQLNQQTVAVKTGTYTLTANDGVILANAGSGAFTVTLPSAVGNLNLYNIKKTDNSTNTVTITASGGQTIDGGASAVIKVQYAGISVVSDGSNWFVI